MNTVVEKIKGLEVLGSVWVPNSNVRTFSLQIFHDHLEDLKKTFALALVSFRSQQEAANAPENLLPAQLHKVMEMAERELRSGPRPVLVLHL